MGKVDGRLIAAGLRRRRLEWLNKKLGRLTFIRDDVGRDKHGTVIIECECDCGELTQLPFSRWKTGYTKSCGCLARETASINNRKHGDTAGGRRPTEYVIWRDMKLRCYVPGHISYPNYGAKGVRVCDRWLDPENGFSNFLADMGRRPSPTHSLDRFPDGNGNYEPGNVRWATLLEQNNNKSNNVYVEIDGVSKTLADWARSDIAVCPYGPFKRRVQKGWDPKVALLTPKAKPGGRPKRVAA